MHQLRLVVSSILVAMNMKSSYTCINCKITFEGGKTRLFCTTCISIKQYCQCNCGEEITRSPFHNTKYKMGHNTRMLSSEEQRRRNSKRENIYYHTSESKAKISAKLKGKTSPRKGAKLSEETKEKLRQANLGKVGMVGSSNPMYGKKHSEAAKRKMKETNASKAREFTCIRCNEIKTCFNTGILRQICNECLNQKNLCKCGCGSYVIASYNNSQMISGHNIVHMQQHSKGERSLKPYLEPLGYIHSEDKNLRISNGYKTRYPDYYNPETKQIVEYFGTYWHRDRELPNNKKHKTPQEVIDFYFKQGWDCIVVWEGEEEQFIDSLILTKVGD